MTPDRILSSLLVAALSGPLLLGETAKQAPDDHKRIQGTWECVTDFKNGKRVKVYLGVRAVMHGNRLTWIFPQPRGKSQTTRGFFQARPNPETEAF